MTDPTPNDTPDADDLPAFDEATVAVLEALEDVLDELREHDDGIPQWEFCEGFLTALLCTRREIAQDEWLPDEAAVAEYLTVVMEENDPAALAKALGTIARARGMSEIAAKAGIGREALYKALRDGASPRYETISRVFQALGVKLVAVPQEA